MQLLPTTASRQRYSIDYKNPGSYNIPNWSTPNAEPKWAGTRAKSNVATVTEFLTDLWPGVTKRPAPQRMTVLVATQVRIALEPGSLDVAMRGIEHYKSILAGLEGHRRGHKPLSASSCRLSSGARASPATRRSRRPSNSLITSERALPHATRDDVQRTLTLYIQGHGNDSDVPQQPTARQQQALLHFGNVAMGPAPPTGLAGVRSHQLSWGGLRTMSDGGEDVRGSMFTFLRRVAVPTCLGQGDRELIAELMSGITSRPGAGSTALLARHTTSTT